MFGASEAMGEATRGRRRAPAPASGALVDEVRRPRGARVSSSDGPPALQCVPHRHAAGLAGRSEVKHATCHSPEPDLEAVELWAPSAGPA